MIAAKRLRIEFEPPSENGVKLVGAGLVGRDPVLSVGLLSKLGGNGPYLLRISRYTDILDCHLKHVARRELGIRQDRRRLLSRGAKAAEKVKRDKNSGESSHFTWFAKTSGQAELGISTQARPAPPLGQRPWQDLQYWENEKPHIEFEK